MVTKHIETLGSKGIPEWLPDAPRRLEWQERKDSWNRIISRKKEAEAAKNARQLAYRNERRRLELDDDSDDGIIPPHLNRPPSPVARVQDVLGRVVAEDDNDQAEVFDLIAGDINARRLRRQNLVVQPQQQLYEFIQTRRQRARGNQIEFE